MAAAPETATQRFLSLTETYRRDYGAWARALYRIRNKAGAIVPLTLNAGQRKVGETEAALLQTRGRARIVILKARQGGFSTDQQARALHLVWSTRGVEAMTLAHTGEDVDKLFGITQRAIRHFPSAWLPKMGGRETNEISFTARDTTFWTGTAGAKRTGRGLTLRRVHGSEAFFWGDMGGTLAALTPTLNGVPQSVMTLESTASGYGTKGHEFWLEAASGKNGYTALFFPWWECDPVNYRLPLLAPDELGKLDDEERELVRRQGLSLPQVKFRRETMEEMGPDSFRQEYAEDQDSCWVAIGRLYYDEAMLRKAKNAAVTPRQRLLGDRLHLFGTWDKTERVVIGCDVAEGMDGDRSTWTARAFPSWRLLATFADNKTPPEELADILNDWGMHFRAFLCIEKNAHGITVIRRLRDHHRYPETALYHRQAGDAVDAEGGTRLGWMTTATVYPQMLDAGRQLLTAAGKGRFALAPSAVSDAFAVRRERDGKVKLSGRDVLVSEILAWLARDQLPQLPEVW